MSLRSALQDLRETTLTAVHGLLGKLAYLGSLRQGQGRYQHWGIEHVYGTESCERALKTAHTEVVTEVLRTPIPTLVEDLKKSSDHSGQSARSYVEEMRSRFEDLLPEGRQNAPASAHLSSVLLALSNLEKNPGRATRSIS